MKKIITTLCIVHQHPKVLLGMKKRGFGMGRWNGFGGKILEGESIEEAAKREVEEESNIKIKNLEKHGILEFEFEKDGQVLEVHVFKAKDFEGEPKESEEMAPKWWFVDEIPFQQMWPDDIHWMPIFLKGRKFKGKFLFGESDVILEQELEEVKEI